MAKPLARTSQGVIYVLDGVEFAAIVTFADGTTVSLTYFPMGGGAHGAMNVPHVSSAKDGENHWRAK